MTLTIDLLGSLAVRRDGDAVGLPQSKKTRALLAYLAATGRRQPRERLCEMLWELPDDPRGALRWSLSKLRQVLPDQALSADRASVEIDQTRIEVDYRRVKAILTNGVDSAATAELQEAAARFRGAFGEDLDLDHSPAFQIWLLAAREEAARLHRQVLQALSDRLASVPEAALPYLQARVGLDPDDERAWADLIGALARAGRRAEAEARHATARSVLADYGGAGRLIDEALRQDSPLKRGAPQDSSQLRQEIRFCRAPDGVRIAYAVAGQGPPLVKTANWLNHLEYDWESLAWRHLFQGLARDFRLLRHDARGNGLSDRDVGELSLEAWLSDLESVVDAAGYERFPLLGVSQGCAIAIAYAAKHPERVTHLVLYAGFAAGAYKRDNTPEDRERRRLMTGLMRLGWGQDHPGFRQLFTSLFIPQGTPEQAAAFNELQRRTASPEAAARYHETSGNLDVRPLLDKVRAPTLVMHPRGDLVVPIETGRQMAAGIPGARFVTLPGQNHLFLEGEPTEARFFDELRSFLAD